MPSFERISEHELKAHRHAVLGGCLRGEALVRRVRQMAWQLGTETAPHGNETGLPQPEDMAHLDAVNRLLLWHATFSPDEADQESMLRLAEEFEPALEKFFREPDFDNLAALQLPAPFSPVKIDAYSPEISPFCRFFVNPRIDFTRTWRWLDACGASPIERLAVAALQKTEAAPVELIATACALPNLQLAVRGIAPRYRGMQATPQVFKSASSVFDLLRQAMILRSRSILALNDAEEPLDLLSAPIEAFPTHHHLANPNDSGEQCFIFEATSEGNAFLIMLCTKNRWPIGYGMATQDNYPRAIATYAFHIFNEYQHTPTSSTCFRALLHASETDFQPGMQRIYLDAHPSSYMVMSAPDHSRQFYARHGFRLADPIDDDSGRSFMVRYPKYQ